jgi:hypothetical protein
MNKHIVKTGFAGDGDGDIVLADPGIKVAWLIMILFPLPLPTLPIWLSIAMPSTY